MREKGLLDFLETVKSQVPMKFETHIDYSLPRGQYSVSEECSKIGDRRWIEVEPLCLSPYLEKIRVSSSASYTTYAQEVRMKLEFFGKNGKWSTYINQRSLDHARHEQRSSTKWEKFITIQPLHQILTIPDFEGWDIRVDSLYGYGRER